MENAIWHALKGDHAARRHILSNPHVDLSDIPNINPDDLCLWPASTIWASGCFNRSAIKASKGWLSPYEVRPKIADGGRPLLSRGDDAYEAHHQIRRPVHQVLFHPRCQQPLDVHRPGPPGGHRPRVPHQQRRVGRPGRGHGAGIGTDHRVEGGGLRSPRRLPR